MQNQEFPEADIEAVRRLAEELNTQLKNMGDKSDVRVYFADEYPWNPFIDSGSPTNSTFFSFHPNAEGQKIYTDLNAEIHPE